MPASWVAAALRAQALSHHRLGREDRAPSPRSHPWTLRSAACPPRPIATMSALGSRWALPRTRSGRRHSGISGSWPAGCRVAARRDPHPRWVLGDRQHGAAPGLVRGDRPGRVFDLGGLGVAWRRVRAARSPADIRAILATSAWGDPGTVVPADMLAWLRLRWAERIAADVPGALRWAAGLFAVLGATTRFGDAGQTALPRWPTGPTGADWLRARSIADMKARLPRIAAWPLEGVTGSADLWRAEAGGGPPWSVRRWSCARVSTPGRPRIR